MNSYAEIKKEYSTILVSILAPLMFQGLQSIFDTAVNYKKKNNLKTHELRIFQDLLRNIVPNWSPNVVEQEVQRIKIMSKYGDTLDKLLQAIVKSYLHLLSGKNDLLESRYINSKMYEAVSLKDFIHKSYIQISREIFNNPFLFSTEVPMKEIKENQKEVLNIIKDSINLCIKDVIPMDKVLDEFIQQQVNIRLLGSNTEKQITQSSKEQNHKLKELEFNQELNQELKKKNETILPKTLLNKEISLINTENGNIVDKVFSSLNIVENKPKLVEEADVRTVTETFNVGGHTVSNFLREAPTDVTEIKQSVLEDYIDVFDNQD